MSDAAAERLMAGAGDYRYWLEEMRHFKPHTLSEAEEKIINIKNVTGVSALNTLYDMITNRYTFQLKVDGEDKELTRGELMVYVRQHDPDLRAQAYQELYRVYGKDGPILGQMYQTLVRDWRNEQVSLRKFATPISARNLINDIPDAVVDTLLDVCRAMRASSSASSASKPAGWAWNACAATIIYAPVAKSDKTLPLRRGRRHGAGFVRTIRPAAGRTGPAGLRPGTPGQRGTQGQARRRLLRHRHCPT